MSSPWAIWTWRAPHCTQAENTFGEGRSALATLDEAVNSLQGGFTLRKPEKMFDIENKAAAFNRAGSEAEVVLAFEAAVEDWCKGTERLLSERLCRKFLRWPLVHGKRMPASP